MINALPLGQIVGDYAYPLGFIRRDEGIRSLHAVMFTTSAAISTDPDNGWRVQVGTLSKIGAFTSGSEKDLASTGIARFVSIPVNPPIKYNVGEIPAIRFVRKGTPALLEDVVVIGDFR